MGVNGWIRKVKEQNPIIPSEYKDPTSINCRRRGGKRPKLTAADKLDIVYKYVVDKIPAGSIAREFKISAAYVSILVKKSEKNNNFFDEMMQQRNDAKELNNTVKISIREYLKHGIHLGSVEEIRKKLHEDKGIEIKDPKLLHIMHKEIGLRYKRVADVSWQGNSERNLILRSQFAQEFYKLKLEKKTIINIDETWLGMTDFRNMSWALPGRPNSVAKKNVVPRISMVVALDSEGAVKITLLQANSNSQVMELFFSNFIRMMDDRNRYWRKHHVILMDNAPYHTSNAMMEFYKEHDLPIMFTGPHSYSASPVELYFAAFKKDDINPRKLPTAKR